MFFFLEKIRLIGVLNVIVIWGVGFVAFVYEIIIISLQIFLYIVFVGQFYLKDSSCYRIIIN